MENKNFEIAIIIGTRAELIKTFPLMIELNKKKIPYLFIHTGQHSLGKLCEEFNIKRPDIVLTKESNKNKFGGNNFFKGIFWNLAVLPKIRKELRKQKNLKYVFYHGDTMTTTTASLASSKILNPFKKYKNAHLEAGLRSFNIFEPFPEEISRRIAGTFSDVLLAVSENAVTNLKNKKRKQIFLAGNTIIDSVDKALKLAKKNKVKLLSKNKFALISIHRGENIKSYERMKKIVEILLSLEVESFFTMHENTKLLLKKYGLLEKLNENKNIKIIPPMNYVSFVYQLSKCSLIICDGGSLQEESLIFHKPCIILRMATERPEGLNSNFQFLSKLDVKETKKKIEEFLSPKFKIKKFKNPYGKIGLTKKIVGVLG